MQPAEVVRGDEGAGMDIGEVDDIDEPLAAQSAMSISDECPRPGLIPGTLIRGSDGNSASSPKANINYILFDEQFRYVPGNLSMAGTSGTAKRHCTEDPMSRPRRYFMTGKYEIGVTSSQKIEAL